MGHPLIFNDTLNITREQGFPADLILEDHLKSPYHIDAFKDKIYTFSNKKDVRFYNPQPGRVFLVENRDGKWIYWGIAAVQGLSLDFVNKTTGGQFKIVTLFSPDEMKQSFGLIDRRDGFDYFENNI